MNADRDFDYRYDKNGINEVIDEVQGSNTFLALREVSWNGSEEYKLDLRRYFVRSDGREIAGKGIAFLSPEGPHRLAVKLVQNGFGDTSDLTNILIERSDFIPALAENITSDQQYDELTSDLSSFYEETKEAKVTAKELLDEILNKKE